VAGRTPALLRAATERAQGTLQVLDVTGWRGLFEDLLPAYEEKEEESSRLSALLPVLQVNAGSLVELRAWDCFEPAGEYYLCVEDIEALLSAAPRLRLLQCEAGDWEEDPTSLLRLLEEEQFAPVRLQRLILSDISAPLVSVLAARLVQHSYLSSLELQYAALEDEHALDAVVNLAISQLQRLAMRCCRLSQASLPALTRMLGSGSLTELHISYENDPLLVSAAVPAFCAALRASRLVKLTLLDVRLWHSPGDGLAVVAACRGHPTLRTINFQHNGLEGAPGRPLIWAALDALAASNAKLHVQFRDHEY